MDSLNLVSCASNENKKSNYMNNNKIQFTPSRKPEICSDLNIGNITVRQNILNLEQ